MELQNEKLYQLIRNGIEQYIQRKQPVLISHIASIGAVNPLSSFVSAEMKHEKEIVYWADAEENLVLVGVGAAYSIKIDDDGADRFSRVEKQWKRILNNSLCSSDYGVPQTGLVLLGGGAFDPLKPRSEKWHHFANGDFHLPRMLLTCKDGNCWLTINCLLQGDENPTTLAKKLLEECKWFLQGKEIPLSAANDLAAVEEMTPDKWMDMVERVVQNIREGEMKKVVLARELHLRSSAAISFARVLAKLQAAQTGSYIFAFARDGDCLIGASPERLIKRKGDEYLSTCLAGSIKRGQNLVEDKVLGQSLLQDKKNRFEQNLVVQMLSDKLNKYCKSLEIPSEPHLKSLKNIVHLCTPLKGKALEGTSLFAVLEDLHPSPALGGFPQKEAMRKIRDEEQLDRGWYGGPVGWVNAAGDGEFIVAIRSGLIRGNEVFLYAGCGIVDNSDPASEYEETQIKFQPMLLALGGS